MFGKQTHSAFNVLVICEIYLFRKEETLFHADAEISDSFNFFSLVTIADSELGYPNTIEILLTILYNIIEDNIKKNKELHSH